LLFKITGKHLSITEDVKKYAEKKTSKFTRYYDSINRVEVIIDAGKNASISLEIIASAEHSKIFVVRESGQDVFACIDSAVHKLEGQLRKKKGKERDNKHVDIA
jgi:putative sigma-54 modulation protein